MAALGIVLVAGVAAGFDLYLAIAVATLLATMDPVNAPPGMEELGSPLLLVPALGMATLEYLAERRPSIDLVWRSTHALVRPVGAAGFAALLAGSLPSGVRLPIAVGAGAIALVIHSARSGWALLSRIQEKRPPLGVALPIEDALVLALVVGLWWAPIAATAGAAVVLVVVLGHSPSLLAAFHLSMHLVRSHFASLARRRGWRSPVQFPDWMKVRLAPAGIVTGGRLRGTPAGCIGYPGPRSVRWGWLLVRGPRPVFALRVRGEVEPLHLQGGREPPVTVGPFCLCVRVPAQDDRGLLLVVPDDGPQGEALRAELSR